MMMMMIYRISEIMGNICCIKGVKTHYTYQRVNTLVNENGKRNQWLFTLCTILEFTNVGKKEKKDEDDMMTSVTIRSDQLLISRLRVSVVDTIILC